MYQPFDQSIDRWSNVFISRQPLTLASLGGNISTAYTVISRPKVPYVYGQRGTNNIVARPLDTTTLGGYMTTVYALISIPKVIYIYGQNGTHYWWNTARHYRYGQIYKGHLHNNINTKMYLYSRSEWFPLWLGHRYKRPLGVEI